VSSDLSDFVSLIKVVDRVIELMGLHFSKRAAVPEAVQVAAAMLSVNLVYRNDTLQLMFNHKDAALKHFLFLPNHQISYNYELFIIGLDFALL